MGSSEDEDSCGRTVKEGNRHGELTNSVMASHSKDRTLAPASTLFSHSENTACRPILDFGVCCGKYCVESSQQNFMRGRDLGRRGLQSFFLNYSKSLASILALLSIPGCTTLREL